MCEEKRKKLRRELIAANQAANKKGAQVELENVKIDEDDPDKVILSIKKIIWIMMLIKIYILSIDMLSM